MEILAMHMANELLSVPVAAITLLVAGGAIAVTARRAQKTLDPEWLPLMGVMGAFVFAAQMINFTLPGMPGTSGHLGGGVLLAILLGPSAAIITMASILTIQCLIFQDGGLLALGCNIINMGIVPCILGWWLYRVVSGKDAVVPAWRQYIAAWAGCLLGVTAGAALVPIESAFAGRLSIPVTHFLAVMIGVHLLIGVVEGAITFAVLAYLRQARPACLGLAAAAQKENISRKAVALSLVITALLLAGVVSWFASTKPDGLEWSYLDHKYAQAQSAIKRPSGTIDAVDELQTKYAPLPDYSARPTHMGAVGAENTDEAPSDDAWPNINGWTSLAGVVGTAVTLVAVYAVAILLGRNKRVLGSGPSLTSGRSECITTI